VLVFVHGYNNRFENAVFGFAQILHDSQAPAAPVLFTWPSRGRILAYGYDRESTNYSRDALESVLDALVAHRDVREIAILSHSMGNWLTMETLRQMAIRRGRAPPKIRDVMLAAPDLDMDVFRRQITAIGAERPRFTLFVSRDDRALALSQVVWQSTARLGSIDPGQEPYRTQLRDAGIIVHDLTSLPATDSLAHGKFAESPEVVRYIGRRLAAGQQLNHEAEGSLQDRVGLAVTGAAARAGATASAIVTAPLVIADPNAGEDGR
jgi:esterase/lipase superfamily enzyme